MTSRPRPQKYNFAIRLPFIKHPRGVPGAAVRFALFSIFGFELFLISAFAADSASEELPPLRPPRGEIPPGFWELYTWHVVAGGLVFLALIALALWWFTRPKPAAVIPPRVQAENALRPLAAEPETGVVLSRVSQALRGYFVHVFALPAGELTTGEFARALETKPLPFPDLADSAVRLLRACDERKFGPLLATEPLRAASQALNLIEQTEDRRAQAAAAAGANGAQPGNPGPGA